MSQHKFPTIHSFWCIDDMLSMLILKKNFCSVHLSYLHATSITTGLDIFEIVNCFFTKYGVTTDGAPNMIGCHSGFQTRASDGHCMIYRQALHWASDSFQFCAG